MNANHVKEIRAFNRFYTSIIGLLDNHILQSKYSLPEVRVLYELFNNRNITASQIVELTDMDKGYLSRVLKSFERNKLIQRKTSATDQRSSNLMLAAKGKKEFLALNNAADKQIREKLKNLSDNDCNELIKKMVEIRRIITKVNQNEIR